MDLTKYQKERYQRQLILPGFGETGQKKLFDSSVLVIGAGGLGSAAILYLTGAGIGNIGVADPDKVDYSNLPRQIIHNEENIGDSKTKSAMQKISLLNSDTVIQVYPEQITRENAGNIIKNYDFVIDATDNHSSKMLINETCVKLNKPYSHAGINSYQGQTMTIIPKSTACLSCLFGSKVPDDLKNTDPIPVFNTVPGIIGTLQATEAIKYLTGIDGLLTNAMLIFNAKTCEFRKVSFKQNKNCETCG